MVCISILKNTRVILLKKTKVSLKYFRQYILLLLLLLFCFAFICAVFFQRRKWLWILYSQRIIQTCHSEVTMQVQFLISEIVLREPAATGDSEVTSHKRQTTNFREGPVRIRALSPMSEWNITRRGKNYGCNVPNS